ncbi:MAG: thioesterase [Firmicutes bacterium HGW-Firmicutes-7]|nr:MAG: thioesterase [Firmicutes bacterium HGW-Firmicutes-7]
MEKTRLFCFPHAGASAAYYTRWSKYLDPNIEIIPVEMSGRGRRMNEVLFNSVEEAVEDVYAFLKSHDFNIPYMLFGHSMGTLIIYELMNKIITNGDKNPLHIFLSGRYPPHINKGKVIHTLSDEDFMQEIIKIGGTPKEICQNKELLELFIPILKADYKIVEQYKYRVLKNKWKIDITALTGNEDFEVSVNEILQWKEYAEEGFYYHVLSGGHFFIHDKEQEVVSIINNALSS